MEKNNPGKDKSQSGGVTDKHDKNAGSGAFNQGSEQDPGYDEGTKVSDAEKRTGHSPSNLGKQRKDPSDGHIDENSPGVAGAGEETP
jgi:hypothetical protein